MYGSAVIAVALNTEDCSEEEARDIATELEKDLNIPVLLPLQDGVGKLVPFLKKLYA
jgi:uncharacterized NAD-dependent epimerase/dehydratase family protein